MSNADQRRPQAAATGQPDSPPGDPRGGDGASPHDSAKPNSRTRARCTRARRSPVLHAAAATMAAIWRHSLPGRMLFRYTSHRGPLLANGLAYGLLFAFFGGVWLAVSAFGLVFTGNADLRRLLAESLQSVIPGVDSLLSDATLSSMSTTFTWTGLATMLLLWWTVTGWMNSLRNAVTAMFDEPADAGRAMPPALVTSRLTDTLAAAAVAVLFILSTVAGAISSGIARALLHVLGIPDDSLPGVLLLEITGFASGLLLNFGLFLLLLHAVAHVRAGRFMLTGSVLGALALAIMQLLGARLLHGASRNPLLAPFAAIIGVLIWFNLVAQIVMLVAAFIAECGAAQR